MLIKRADESGTGQEACMAYGKDTKHMAKHGGGPKGAKAMMRGEHACRG
jgi:hypothetical protein